MLDSAMVHLVASDGTRGELVVSRLPSSRYGPELRPRDDVLTVREGLVYRFRFEVGARIVSLEPAELFDGDDESSVTGRLVPGEAVGVISVAVTTDSGEVLRGRFNVRSAKFSDDQAFGRMLADLAELSVEAMHQGFAPSSGEFGSAVGDSPRLLYQQFAVLQSLLVGSDLAWAIAQILSEPHREWKLHSEARPPGRPIRGSSRLGSQLGRPGPRVATLRGPLPSMPRTLLVERTEETTNTSANRFVQFVLERWRSIAAEVVLQAEALGGAAKRRGVEQARDLLVSIDEYLAAPLFKEVGRLSVFPGDNQVLRRREGYRQLYAAWALVEGTVGLEIDLEDPLLISRKSIATLYEYWTFIRLAGAVAEACGNRDIAEELFKPSATGMSLVLRAGATTRLKFNVDVASETVFVDLFFNKQFRESSWTRPMRPDASLVLRRRGSQEVWLHFDAKYRVDWSIPFETGEVDEEEQSERTGGTSKRTDLLKMHAYRDAIRDSAGSYVLFPGSDSAEFAFDKDEFLPGLGAFPLRPHHSEDDTTQLAKFVARAIRHVAASGTRHRRATYWTARAYEGEGTQQTAASPPAGQLPPADTAVLLGYVRSDEQWQWIRRVRLYNVRSGQRSGTVTQATELDGPLVLLYGQEADRPHFALFERTGSWNGVTADALHRLGYPQPRGEAYLLTGVTPLLAPAWLEEINMSRLLPDGWLRGRPYTTTWLDVVLSTQAPDS